MPNIPPIGIQLYSVRNSCSDNLDKTLAKLSDIGIKGVEFHTNYKLPVQALKSLIKKYNLECWGYHVPYWQLTKKHIHQTIADHHYLENKRIIIPTLVEEWNKKPLLNLRKKFNQLFRSSDDNKFDDCKITKGLKVSHYKTEDFWIQASEKINKIYSKLSGQGLELGFHNHSIEFRPLSQSTPWEIMGQNLHENVFFQLDTGNALNSGADLNKLISNHGKRIQSIHLKPYSQNKNPSLIGDDETEWALIFQHAIAQKLKKWAILEFDYFEGNDLEAAEKQVLKLKELLKH